MKWLYKLKLSSLVLNFIFFLHLFMSSKIDAKKSNFIINPDKINIIKQNFPISGIVNISQNIITIVTQSNQIIINENLIQSIKSYLQNIISKDIFEISISKIKNVITIIM